MSEPHEVSVPCACSDIDHCAMERYIADVRIAFDEIERLMLLMPEQADELVAA